MPMEISQTKKSRSLTREPDTGTDDLTDGSPMFYQVLDENTEPYPEQVQRMIHMYSSAVLQKAM